MTAQEAIKHLKEITGWSNFWGGCYKEKLSAIDMAIEALKKQIPKKPDFEGDGYWNGELVYDIWICPYCEEHYEVDYEEYCCCPKCGQKIDWGEDVV